MKRYSGLDVLKLILSFFVICLHVEHFWSSSYEYMICRTAVPCFFMITGYFYPNIIVKNSQNKQIKKILFIIVVSILFYLLYALVGSLIFYDDMFIGFKSVKLDIVKIVFFNVIPMRLHLWYLFALLYTLIIAKFVKKEVLDCKLTCVVILVCLILSLIIGKYCIPLFNKDMSGQGYNTNFITLGIPFFLIGYKLNQFNERHESIKLKERLICFAIALGISYIEVYLYDHSNYYAAGGEMYITTPILSVVLFLIFLKLNFENKIWLLVSRLGKTYSAWIYVLHIMIYDLVCNTQFVTKMDIPYFELISPFLTFGLTLIISIIINNIWMRIKPYVKR